MGSEARARLGLWFLLSVALISFNQLFATGDYPGPALLGMLAATGIAVGLRRLGLGTFITFFVSALALVTYVSLVFEAPHTLWGLPTLDSLSGLWRNLQRAAEHSSIDYAPVPLRPGYAIMVVASMWVATTIGEVATFRWRRPLTASLLPIVIFSVALTVGTATAGPVFVALFMSALLTYWGLESAHRMRAWGRWVSAWSHRKEIEPESITGELARRLGAIAVAAAIVSPLFLPALENGLLSWRSGIGPGIGDGSGSGSGRLNPWVSIVPNLPTQTDAVLFTVTSEKAAYWRVSSLEVFNGTSWSEAEESRSPADQGVVGGPSVPLTASEPLIQEIEIEGLRGGFLPAALAAESVVRIGESGPAAVAGFGYDPDSGAILLDDELDEGQRYRVTSSTPSVDFAEMRAADPASPDVADPQFFQLDQPLSPQAKAEVQRWIANAKTPFAELVAIQDHLRAFDYTLEPASPQGDDPVADFLLRTQEGFCQQFATAFAVIARDLGYPARVSVGFLPGSQDESNRFTVRGTDAHAWPEVFFETYGWISFEPTPRGESVAPTYTLPDSDGSGSGDFDLGLNPFQDAGAGQGGAAFDVPGGGGPGVDRLAGNPGEELGGVQPGRNRGTARWEKTFATLLAVLAVLLGLFLASVPGLKEWRIRRRYARAVGPDGLAAAAFVQFEDEAAELAEPRAPWESAKSYAARLVAGRQVAERTATRLATIYEAAAYGATDITGEQAREAQRLARALRKQLWRQASWWARLARLFSPKRLRTTG